MVRVRSLISHYTKRLLYQTCAARASLASTIWATAPPGGLGRWCLRRAARLSQVRYWEQTRLRSRSRTYQYIHTLARPRTTWATSTTLMGLQLLSGSQDRRG